MGRSGYVEDMDDVLAHGRWRAAVNSAMRGKRGQAFLLEMLAAMDALPEKKLISGDLVDKDGCACALGTVALARGVDTSEFNLPDDADEYEREEAFANIGGFLGVADAMAREIMWANDEGSYDNETPEQRFARMRGWIVRRIGQWRVMVEGDL